MVSELFQRLHEDLAQLCDRIDVPLAMRVPGVPSMLTVELRAASDDVCRVTLHRGGSVHAERELAIKTDQELVQLLSNPPYMLAKRTPDTSTFNYLVRRAKPGAVAATLTPAPSPAQKSSPSAAPKPAPAPAPAPARDPNDLSIRISDTNLSPSAYKIPMDGLTEISFLAEQKHKANLGNPAAHISFACDLETWKAVMGAAADAYCTKLSQLFPRLQTRPRKELRAAVAAGAGAAVAKLQRFGKMLIDTQARHGEPLAAMLLFEAIRVCVKLPMHDADEVAEMLARFTQRADAVATSAATMVSKVPEGKRLEFKPEDNGFILQWVGTNSAYYQRFDNTGKPVGGTMRVD